MTAITPLDLAAAASDVDWQTQSTGLGTWRRARTPWGRYCEFVSHRRVWGLPLVHITLGRHPETGRRKLALGIIAIGRIAIGGLAIGQVAVGSFTLAQLSLGSAIGVGQLATGSLLAVGQLALSIGFALGQIAIAWAAVGQLCIGHYVLAQVGVGTYVWDMHHSSAIAGRFFHLVARDR